MRVFLSVINVSIAALLSLALIGCGGGGGGGTPDSGTPPSKYGDYTIDTTAKTVSYTQPVTAPKQVSYMWADFTNGTTSFSQVPFIQQSNGTWVLDLSSNNQYIPTTATGSFQMTVYAIVTDQHNNGSLQTIGKTRPVTLNGGSDPGGGGGPPPPPF